MMVHPVQGRGPCEHGDLQTFSLYHHPFQFHLQDQDKGFVESFCPPHVRNQVFPPVLPPRCCLAPEQVGGSSSASSVSFHACTRCSINAHSIFSNEGKACTQQSVPIEYGLRGFCRRDCHPHPDLGSSAPTASEGSLPSKPSHQRWVLPALDPTGVESQLYPVSRLGAPTFSTAGAFSFSAVCNISPQ